MGFLAAILASTLATAQSAPTSSEPPQIRVTGHARISAQPEQAEVDVGVVTEAPEAGDAARTNAEKLDRVLKALQNAFGPGARFETVSYSLNPVYRHDEPRGQPVITGYHASNTLRVRDLQISQVGKAIDTATSSGANSVHNIVFKLKDEAAVQARALRDAAADARAKAQALGEALGLRVVRILVATEGEPEVIRPMPMYRAEMAMAAQAPPTPVEPGAIEVRASVMLVVEVSP
jgi:uncharacterized protein YggE